METNEMKQLVFQAVDAANILLALKPTHCGELLGLMTRDNERIQRRSLNWTASGAEAIITDGWDNQKYHIVIEPYKEVENAV